MLKQEQPKHPHRKYILNGNEKSIADTVERMRLKGLELTHSKPVERYGKPYVRLDFKEPVKEEETENQS